MDYEPYPYCPHGKYIGGCAEDWMCFECEMDYEAPSINDLRAEMRSHYTRACGRMRVAVLDLLKPDPETLRAAAICTKFIWEDATKILQSLQQKIDSIAVWATSPDDVEWIYRRHEAAAKEWQQKSREEQFNSLPAHVLDGRY